MKAFSNRNEALDAIIESRRSVRRFKAEAPPREAIEEIIQAGMLAPYARISVTRDDFRKFVVIPRESHVTARAIALMKRRAAAAQEELEEQMRRDEFSRSHGAPYLERLKALGQQGPPNVGKAPYYVMVAEQKGVPAVASLSLAHCLENMWLKATALGLGFQLLTFTERMEEDEDFCRLIDVPCGEFALDGCLIGYPDESPPATKRPDLAKSVKWL